MTPFSQTMEPLQKPGRFTLYSLLDLRTEEERLPLRLVATEWTEAGGLINLRALGEIVKAHIIAEKNRQIAIQREQKKRLKLVAGGRS